MSWHMTQKQLVPICSRFTNYYTTSRFISPWFFSLSIKLTISCLQRADTLLAKRVQTGQQFWSPILHVLLAQAAFWQQRTEVFRSDSDAVTANGRCRLGHTRCSFRFHFSYLSQNLLAENCANYRIQILKCNTHTSTSVLHHCHLRKCEPRFEIFEEVVCWSFRSHSLQTPQLPPSSIGQGTV